MFDPARIQALLFDLDGVLFVGDDVVPGSPAAIADLARRGFTLRFLTNTSASPRSVLLRKLHDLGISVEPDQLFTPAALARRALGPDATWRLLGNPALEEDFGPNQIPFDDPATPDAVIMGLHPPLFHHDALNVVFNDLLNGARLVALHASRMWRTARGMEPGLGAYVRGLEYAAGVEALVMGKPSAAFYEQVLVTLPGVSRDAVLMVGDDVDSDVGGAQAIGITGALVRTGKFSERTLAASPVTPALIVDDVSDLARRLP